MSVIRRANRRRKRSSLELKVHAWLKEDGIPFKIEKAIGRCHVDVFIEPRTIVELQGCFWHGCMICNRQLDHKQKVAQIKDARRFAFFRNRGFDVIAIWECEVDGEPERVRAVLKALREKAKT
jgi:G:T-mismatch repair DNA endonuclease (very short patch repair protein)